MSAFSLVLQLSLTVQTHMRDRLIDDSFVTCMLADPERIDGNRTGGIQRGISDYDSKKVLYF